MKFPLLLFLVVFAFSSKAQLTQNEQANYQAITKTLNSVSYNFYNLDTFNLYFKRIDHTSSIAEPIKRSLTYIKSKNIPKAFETIYKLVLKNDQLSSCDSLILFQQMGVLKFETDDYSGAEEYLNKAYKIHQRLGVKSNILESWLTFLFKESKQFKKAIAITRKTLERSDANKIKGYTNLGIFYQEDKNLKASNHYFDLALNELNKAYNGDAFRFIYLYKANNSLAVGKINEAVSFYKKSLSDTLSIQNWYPYIMSNYQLTTIYLQKKNLDSCEYYLDKFFVCPCLDNPTKSWLYTVKANYYLKIGNKQRFIDYSQQALQLNDSVNADFRQKIASSTEIYNAQIKLIESNLKYKSQISELLENERFIYKFLLFAFILLALTIGYFSYQNFKKNKQISKDKLELTEAKLETVRANEEALEFKLKSQKMDVIQLAKNLTLKREFDDQQKQMIKGLLDKKEQDLKFELKQIYNQITAQEQIDEHLESTQLDLDKINHEFFSKMKEQFPQLSNNDIEICSLHLMKLNTKEIAALKNVEPKTIQNSRYRIKKKLNLGEEDDLLTYLEKRI